MLAAVVERVRTSCARPGDVDWNDLAIGEAQESFCPVPGSGGMAAPADNLTNVVHRRDRYAVESRDIEFGEVAAGLANESMRLPAGLLTVIPRNHAARVDLHGKRSRVEKRARMRRVEGCEAGSLGQERGRVARYGDGRHPNQFPGL